MSLIRRHFRKLLVLSIILSQVGTALIVATVISNRRDADIAALRSSVLGACQRLNVLRRANNRDQLASVQLFQITYTALRLNPAPFEQALVKQIKTNLATMEWVPLTDCHKALDSRGVRYTVPHPVLFSRRIPGPSDR